MKSEYGGKRYDKPATNLKENKRFHLDELKAKLVRQKRKSTPIPANYPETMMKGNAITRHAPRLDSPTHSHAQNSPNIKTNISTKN